MIDLSKNSIITVTVDGYSSDGSGVAHPEGRAVFIKGALYGETCEIKILKVTKTLCYAKIEKVLVPSVHRIVPECASFGKCGGCSLMHMDYDEELRFKVERINDAFERIGGLSLKLSSVTGSDSITRYRNKAIFEVGGVTGAPVSGFFRSRSHDVTEVSDCLIQTVGANRARDAVLRWMKEYNVAPYSETDHTGVVRHVFSRVSSHGEIMVVIVTATDKLSNCDKLVSYVREACPATVSIIQNVNKTFSNTVLSGKMITLFGSNTLRDTLCGLEFELSPLSFYQINHDQAEKLYDKALEYADLKSGDTALDLYCGTGTITLCLAKRAGHAIGAEIVPDAVEDARKNAEKNGSGNVEFICADASLAADELCRRGLRPNVIVIDPPRKGTTPEVIDTITSMSPDRVVYVSCDPATLARDLKIFTEKGFSPVKAEAFDLFPRTPHVETIVLMSKINKYRTQSGM